MDPTRDATDGISLALRPPDWIIESADTDEGLLLSWPLNSSWFAKLSLGWGRIFMPVWLCGWAACEIGVTYAVISGHLPPTALIFLFFCTIGGAWAIFTCVALYKPSRPEAIVLGDNRFGYDPGQSHPAMSGSGYSFAKVWRFVLDPPRRIFLDKRDLEKFELERIGEHQRLSFQHDMETVEIGNCLSETERIWLFTMLENWRRGIDLARLKDVTAETYESLPKDPTAIVANRNDLRR